MIFGQTKSQREKDREGRWWFAWHPVQLDDGRICWLQNVWRTQRSYYDFMGGYSFENRYYETVLEIKTAETEK